MNVVNPDLAPKPDDILDDPVYSDWLKNAVQDLLLIDAEKAFNEAEELRNVMERRFADIVKTEDR